MTSVVAMLSLFIGGWEILNGILHDIFILNSDHGKKYDRNLLRLLMDGHILITCGAMQMISYLGLKNGESWGIFVAAMASISLLVYCGLIFPFLKSIFTILINLSLLILLVISFLRL